ncbi:hypothetical protein E5161_20255 [Cohnella pontilimi]|uniref:Uncharacterized protein n=1 Tax=Cohnella pontilimi TaxID=2564100 RepID=A0A4U0F231_9BACL|nr:hypothetical protein [Cohnella pontilimi]TJY38517.1 hypothetical protein E5161_20255 [Cohnella pontilimi]
MLKNAILIVKYDGEVDLEGFIEADGYDVFVTNCYEELDSADVEKIQSIIEEKLNLEDVMED